MKWVVENIQRIPSFSLFLEYIDIIENNVVSNPTLCVESCKSLIEGICKTILTNKDIQISRNTSFSALVQLTIDSILRSDETYRADIIDLGRRIAGVADKVGLLRNHSSFVSHGMDILNPRLTETLSTLIYNITDTICGFILSCYNNNRIVSIDHRIHYDDCLPFNDYFDEMNPMPLGLLASRALFDQDYEAFKEAYFEYLNNLESDFLIPMNSFEDTAV